MEEFGFKVLRGTYEDWQTYLAKYEEEYGEPYIPEEGKLVAVGFEDEQTGEIFFKLKIGNGNTEFNDLPYTDKIADSGMTVDEIVETLDTKQDKLNAGDGIIIETSTGPNMFNIEDSFKSVLTPTGTTKENQDYITSNYIKVKANTTYVISNNYREFKEIAVALYDTNKHFIEYKSNTGTSVNNGFQYYRFNATQDGYLRFTVYGTNTKIMLNKGTTYLPYEDYVEIENTISAVGGSSGGSINYHTNVTSKPKVNGVELDGNLTSDDLGLQSKREWETILTRDISDSSTDSYYDFNIFTDTNDEYKKIRMRLTMESNTTGHMSSSSNAIYIDNYMIASSTCPAGAALEEHKGLDTYVIFDFENCVCIDDVGLITTNNIKHNNTKVSVFPKMNNNKQLGLQIYSAYPLVFDNATLIVEGMRW